MGHPTCLETRLVKLVSLANSLCLTRTQNISTMFLRQNDTTQS